MSFAAPIRLSLMWTAALAVPAAALAQSVPTNLLPPERAIVQQPVEADSDAVAAPQQPQVQPTQVQPLPAPAPEPVLQSWTAEQAAALLALAEGIKAEGLDPADYNLPALRAAMAAGQGIALDREAARVFAWLIEDMRDGRTPMSHRKQWFVMDPDADRMPTGRLMAEALASGDFAAVLQSVAPVHPDYARLREALAATPASDGAKRKLIRANMDRWRWLARDLGSQYLMTNVPEFQLRLTVKDKIVRTYRTIVGKPGRQATPQLAESVEGVIFNPTWTVPQSIVKGEGLGARVLGNPAWAKRAGYTATRGANGFVTVVQQPGPGNSLGFMKLDMPNRHAIFLHDTPNRNLFASANRALSHGCVRTERATELAITLSILQAGLTADEGVATLKSGKYTRVPFTKKMPVYITYFTYGTDIDGTLRSFGDIYGRDAPVLASLDAPRVADRPRVTDEEVIEILDDPRA
ncbi:L,D-transpeptidase family protein [Altererythrobacter sp. H2]|uniref:L,D-transpeptidase family protein n=1 Tax=Altererythrobacter sp. H2 TaxID=3108391 RepID=UPI002B4BF828|nr:L,D-transpeptidase family protein [Altererythrobacter sp. H2]WRK95734.1 L,D-transpeptidase family protein [Altererythrobacter sp. H2]